MNPDDIVTQLGLLLSQFRYTRRAIEDIERSTAKYTGLAFAPMFAEGPRFGQPPMLNGALRVYVVNINDLTEPPAGGILEGLLGGAGRFLGGLIGGIAGGTVSSVLFPWVVSSLARIAESIDKITARIERIINYFKVKPSAPTKETPKDSVGGMFSGLPGLTAILNDVTALLRSANGEKLAEGKAEPSKGVDQVLHLLKEISGVIDGLILLLPIVNGFLASLIVRLDSIKLAVVELLEWLVRNVLLLRGLVLVVIQDTLAQVARLAGKLMHIAGGLLSDVLKSAFEIVKNLLTTAMTVLSWIGTGLKGIMTDLMEWLRTGLGNFLIFLGNTPIVQFLFHIVDVLPNLLPAIIKLVNPEKPLSDAEMKALEGMQTKPLTFSIPPVTGGTTPSGSGATFPDLAKHLPDPKDMASILDASRDFMVKESDKLVGSISTRLQEAATSLKTADFDKGIADHLTKVQKRASEFADTLKSARADATAGKVDTGVEMIAKAYEEWLTKGGLETLLSNITAHFQRNTALPEKVKEGTEAESPRATVQIDQVEIIIEPPAVTSSAVPPSAPVQTASAEEPRKWIWSPFQPMNAEDVLRGAVPEPFTA
jgi:hypothetical protein